MAFSSIVRALARSPLTTEFLSKLNRQQDLRLNGIPRLPKGLVASALAQKSERNLFVVCATLEEAGRAYAQLEAMGWHTVHFYPTSEASPYEPFDPETELTWGQMQVLADLIEVGEQGDEEKEKNTPPISQSPHTSASPDGDATRTLGTSLPITKNRMAIVATTGALQPHLPPPAALTPFCLTLKRGMEFDLNTFSMKIATLGYERVPLVETEGQWSRRGDIVDVFPVASELPVRLEWFGDEIEQIREFDPGTQRSALDKINQIILTPTSFAPIIQEVLKDSEQFRLLTAELNSDSAVLEGSRRFLGLAFEQPASLLEYLNPNTLVVIDEPEQCYAHSDRWVENAEEQWRLATSEESQGLPKIHRSFDDSLAAAGKFLKLYLSELAEENSGTNLASRPVPITPHQFAKLAETLRQERDRHFSVWLISAQPTRSVSLLQEHDCPAQFIPNPRDYLAIEKLQVNHTPIALKYSGLAELEGFILPTYRIVVVTDREFYGQHSLASPSYIRKRRQAVSKQVDPNKLRPGDYVVHRSHGIGKFVKLESLTINDETRDYLVVQYGDGILRVAADQVGSLSRFRTTGDKAPELHKMTGKAWENTKNKVRKAIKKLAVDLLKLYAARAKQEGFCYPQDMPWQEEMEDSFPYQATTDQLKAVQDVKRDMESDRPMDRLVCGDVGFGKTEVAIRAIFKAVTAGKQVALLAPTTILTQQQATTRLGAKPDRLDFEQLQDGENAIFILDSKFNPQTDIFQIPGPTGNIAFIDQAMNRLQQDTMAMVGMTQPGDTFNPEVMSPGNSGAKLQLALGPNQIIQDNTIKNCAEGLKDALWLVWRTLVQYGDDYGVKKLAQEFHPEKKAEFLDYIAFDDMNFNERKTLKIDLALGMRSEDNALQRLQIIKQAQQGMTQEITAGVSSGALTPQAFKKLRKPYEDMLYVLGIKDADAYLPTGDEVMAMVKQAQESAKSKQPTPQEQKDTASAQLDAAKAQEIQANITGKSPQGQLDATKAQQIQADVAGNTASQQLEGYALLKEHKARAYGA